MVLRQCWNTRIALHLHSFHSAFVVQTGGIKCQSALRNGVVTFLPREISGFILPVQLLPVSKGAADGPIRLHVPSSHPGSPRPAAALMQRCLCLGPGALCLLNGSRCCSCRAVSHAPFASTKIQIGCYQGKLHASITCLIKSFTLCSQGMSYNLLQAEGIFFPIYFSASWQ